MTGVPKSLRNFSLSTYLMAIVLIAVVPTLVFCTFVIDRLMESERESSRRYLIKSADELAFAVDQEIMGSVRALQAVGNAHTLRTKQFDFYQQVLARTLKSQPSWSNILLHSDKAERLLSALEPYSKKIESTVEPGSIAEAIKTRTPVAGPVVKVPEGRGIEADFAFAIRVPVFSDQGNVVYVLSAIITTDDFHEIITRYQSAPNEWTRAVVDRFGTLAARSREPEKFVGGLAAESLRAKFKNSDSGLERTETLEGIPAYTAYRKASFSGWYTAVAVPVEALEAEYNRTFLTLITLAILLLTLSTISTVYFSRWLRGSIKAGADAAATLAKGDIPVLAPSRIQEVELLRSSLLSASVLLKTREKAKSDFLANMSHELRTPLGIVIGMTDSLSSGLIPTQEEPKVWEIIKRNGQQLLRLIDDILDISKVDARRLTVEKINFSLRDLISATIEDFAARAQDRGIKVQTEFDAQANDVINSDPVRIRQVLVNLVGNAVKFTSKGDVTLRLHATDGNRARITVTDSGIGLTPEQQSQLFVDFTQGDSSHTRKYGGTGLGLSLSRKLAQLLGGDVRLTESSPGKGSTFEFTFVANSTSGWINVATSSRKEAIQPAARGTVRLLLAEDSPDNVTLIQTYLKKSNIDVTIANNGLEAVELVKNNTYDVILMDIQMPMMDGYQATQTIRETNLDVPIIALTAHALAEHRAEALKSGFTDFLTKPIKRELLIQTVEKYIQS